MGGRPYLNRYVPGGEVGTKLYCLVTEAHVCEQLAENRYFAVPPGRNRTCNLPSQVYFGEI